MPTIKRFVQYLTEMSLSRVWQTFGTSEYPAGIMSAWKSSLPEKENAARTKALANKMRAAGYGYIYVDGMYKGQAETSLAVRGTAHDNGKLKGLLRKWRADYDQESVLFKPEGSDHAVLVFSDHEEDLGTFHPNHAADFMTALRGRPGSFVFEAAYEPMNFFAKLAEWNRQRRQSKETL